MGILDLNYIGTLESYKAISAENPLDEIWNWILRLSDYNYLSQTWEGQKSEDYLYVCTCIAQANEFFKASKVVSLKTKPLLLYYSFLNLTKAAIFIRSDQKPADYHGLCDPKEDQNRTSSFLDYSVKVNNGIFLDLSKILSEEVKVGKIFCLNDFCGNVIEISFDFFDYFKKELNVITPKVDVSFSGCIYLSFDEQILKNIPDLFSKLSNNTNVLSDFEVIEQKNDVLKLKNKNKIDQGKLQVIGSQLMAKHFIYSVFPDQRYYLNVNDKDRRMPQEMAYFGIMFLLGSFVRYEPLALHEFLEDRNTSLSWFIGRLCEVAERVYPNLMLNLLYREKLKFSTY